MRTAAICPTCATYENALCVLYNGEYLPNIDVEPLDSLEVALQKINNSINSSPFQLEYIQLEYEGASPKLTLVSIPKVLVSFAGIELESGNVWADFNYTDLSSYYNNINGTTSLSFPNLNGITSLYSVAIDSLTLTNIEFPVLKTVMNGLNIDCDNLTNIDLSSLEYCSSLIVRTGLVTEFTLDSFKYCYDLSVFGSSLTILNLPALNKVLNQLTSSYSSSLTEINLSNNLTEINGNVSFSNNALLQSSIDDILVKLAALDGTGETVSFSNKAVYLDGGTNATPSATGLAAKAILVARGCTVTNN